MLQTVVSVNNALWQTVDTVKLVGSTLMGSMEVELVISESDVKFLISKTGDDGEVLPVAEILGGTGAETTDVKSGEHYKKVTDTPDALTAIEGASGALKTLNEALKEVPHHATPLTIARLSRPHNTYMLSSVITPCPFCLLCLLYPCPFAVLCLHHSRTLVLSTRCRRRWLVSPRRAATVSRQLWGTWVRMRAKRSR